MTVWSVRSSADRRHGGRHTLVRDLFPGTGSGGNDARRIAWQGELYFLGNDGGDDYGNNELWRSDGTEAGTVLVRDIRPVAGSAPGEFAAGPDLLFFVANDGSGEVHTWLTDGTAAGTKKAENPAVVTAAGAGPNGLVRLGDRILSPPTTGASTAASSGRSTIRSSPTASTSARPRLVRDRAVGPDGQSTPSSAAAVCTCSQA